MEFEKAITLVVLLAATVLIVTEWLPIALVALLAPLTLVLCQVIEPQTLWDGLASPAVIAIAGMFVVSAGLSRTGALSFLGDAISSTAARGRRSTVAMLMVGVAVLSAFVNNTTVVLVGLPVVLAMCERLEHPPSRYLIPLSFASIFGGMMTLIGTSTNVVVQEKGSEAVARVFGPDSEFSFAPQMWDFTPVGVVFVAIGVIYMSTIGVRLLPDRTALSMTLGRGKVTEYVTEVEIPTDSSFVGRKLGEVLDRFSLRPLQLVRGDDLERASREAVLEAGDLVIVKGRPAQIFDLRQGAGKGTEVGEAHTEHEEEEEALRARPVDMTLAEVIVPPRSRWVGRAVRDIGFRARYGVTVIALQRHGHHLRQKVGEIIVEPADMLLVQGTVDSLRRLRASEHLILVEGVNNEVKLRALAPRALMVLGIFVALVGTEIVDIATAAVCGASLMVLSRCITVTEAFNNLDWNVLFLIAGFLVLGTAMQEVGVSRDLAVMTQEVLAGTSPVILIGGLYLFVALLSDIMSNAAAASLMVPVTVDLARVLEVNPEPLLMTVAFAASAAFLTPVGYQTNLLVFAPGGYRFTDFVRVGLPLRLVFVVVAAFLIPYVHPFD